MEQQFIKINGISIRVLIEKSEGPWLVLWPGMGAAAEEFLALLNGARSKGANVISIDPPGHGKSEEWPEEMTKESVQLIWKSVFNHFDIPSAYIGGHSYGAYTAVWAEAVLENRVKGLILLDGGYIDPFVDVDLNIVAQQNKAFLESREFDSWDTFLEEEKASALTWDETIETMLKSTMKCRDGKIVPRISLKTANQVTRLLSEYRSTDIKKVNSPIRLLYATLPEEYNGERRQGIEKLLQVNGNVTCIPVPKSGHDLFIDHPNFVINHIWNTIKVGSSQ
jgi:pimeloyl-ACP methyl ester carboxylesterase